jgi:hypothetical protein
VAPGSTNKSLENWLLENDPVLNAAMEHMCDELHDRLGEVTSMLQRLDRRGSGELSREEMERGLQGLGIHLSPDELHSVVDAFDNRGNGQVAWGHFMRTLETWVQAGGSPAQQAPSSPRSTGLWAPQASKSAVTGAPLRLFSPVASLEASKQL